MACFPWESQEEVIECKSTNRELSQLWSSDQGKGTWERVYKVQIDSRMLIRKVEVCFEKQLL